jgi:hypothetical protein
MDTGETGYTGFLIPTPLTAITSSQVLSQLEVYHLPPINGNFCFYHNLLPKGSSTFSKNSIMKIKNILVK